MFPYNNQNPFPYHSTQTLHQNPISTHHGNHQESPFLLHFPSPFLDDTSPLSQVLPQPQTAAGDQVSGKGKTKKGGPRKRNPGTTRGRTGKKDRHSKICTARGVRDRRMRLSLQIARKFFDLQDMLGFDKASKTIEWLFSKSKKAIKELMRTKNMDTNFSSSDEYEVRSIMEENNYSNNNEAITSVKESRQKARARARERTKEKKMVVKGLESSTHFYESNPSSLEQLGSSSNSPFLEESCCQEIGSNNNNNNAPLLGFENQFASSVGIMDKYLGGASYGALWAPDWRAESSILSSKYGADSYAIEHHQENGESFMGFLGDGGINPNMDGLPPYAGINPSTLYFGATIPNFQFMQPLDQEKQFPCNHYSLG